jgi:gamma-carbonic anhydrase
VRAGDKNKVKIGFKSNIQDRAVIDCSANVDDASLPKDVDIGSYVTIGHGALLKSCIIGDEVLIGQGAIVEEGSVVEEKCMIAAGAVVTAGTLVPKGQLWAGNPAKFVRDLSEEELAFFKKSADAYSALREAHRDEFLPYGTAYQSLETK